MEAKTRQKIYEEQTLKHLGNNSNGTRMDIVESSMEEYATQQATEFADWLHEMAMPATKTQWQLREGKYNIYKWNDRFKTTKELYELFNANG